MKSPPPRARALVVLATVAALLGGAAQASSTEEIRLWPGVPPGDESFSPPSRLAPPKNDGTQRVTLVTEPTLSISPAPVGRANGTAVVVYPGGGYNILAWDKEGTEVAAWLNDLGVTAAVLKYRVPRRDPAQPHVAPLRDAQRALRLLRQRAREWNVDVDRVGILGFSAGGNLAVMAATSWQESTYSQIDAADVLSARPDFVMPIYPAYLGNEDTPGPLSPAIRIGPQTPPMFLLVTHDDRLRGLNAALLYAELKQANVAAELHIFSRGGHGYGLRPSENPVSGWPRLAEQWLQAMGFLPGAAGGRH